MYEGGLYLLHSISGIEVITFDVFLKSWNL